MTRQSFQANHRLARMGALGTLACSLGNRDYQWFLTQVYDARFPHIGDARHELNGRLWNDMRHGGYVHGNLVAFHQKRGWFNCRHKPLIRLWTEFRAISKYDIAPKFS